MAPLDSRRPRAVTADAEPQAISAIARRSVDRSRRAGRSLPALCQQDPAQGIRQSAVVADGKPVPSSVKISSAVWTMPGQGAWTFGERRMRML